MKDISQHPGNVQRRLVRTEHVGKWVTRRQYVVSDCDVPLFTIEIPTSVMAHFSAVRLQSSIEKFDRGRATMIERRKKHKAIIDLLTNTNATMRTIARLLGVSDALVSYVARKNSLRHYSASKRL